MLLSNLPENSSRRMRILLDESLPRQLAQELPGHEVQTVQKRGWAGLKNGDLLRIASAYAENKVRTHAGRGCRLRGRETTH